MPNPSAEVALETTSFVFLNDKKKPRIVYEM